MISLINLGNSNIQSVINALMHLGIKFMVTNTPSDLIKLDKFILPGVGSFENGIKQLKNLNIFDILIEEITINKKPILGICLGMQLLFEDSEESKGTEGLGLLKGSVVKVPKSDKYSIPRIGWDNSKVNFDFLGLKKDKMIDLYYIHSYHAIPMDSSIVSINTDLDITAAVKEDNIYGCQFHPEKSYKDGLKIIKSFCKL